MKKLFNIFCLSFLLLACQQQNPNALRIGAIAGPETEILETAAQVAKKEYGLDIQIISFNDYNLPNEALVDGSLDANIFQHLPYLESAIAARHYPIEAIGKTFIYPVAIYSKKWKNLDALPDKALIALPNDPSNGLRALRLLEKAKLIVLRNDRPQGLQDIIANPKHLQFKEMDAAQLPRILADVDAAVINTNYGQAAGLDPSRDGLFSEDKNSPYANLVVIRQNSAKKEQLELFLKALHSDEVKAKARSLFGSHAIPAW